nr:PREDICTED: transmembrane protein 236 [Latimeria chalumnae]|eukprot:XP_006004835.1 PREDICTED: transmembrane protein 236 [Latimeria chalumnae]
MGLGKRIKLVVFEVLQFAAMCVPTFVVVQRFASSFKRTKEIQGQEGHTAYWLIIACSIAYVTSVALLIWVPVKVLIYRKKRFLSTKKTWYVQVHSQLHEFDTFTELPISLVICSLILVDITEKLKKCHLRGRSAADTDAIPSSSPMLTYLEHISTISGHISRTEENHVTPQNEETGSVTRGTPATAGSVERRSSISEQSAYTVTSLYSASQYNLSGPLKVLAVKDFRAEIFVTSFMIWFDTVEMVRAGGVLQVFCSGWIFPVYIVSYISLLRVVVKPANSLLSSLTVISQDFPFFFIRLGLLVDFGFVTPVLYLLKNFSVSMAYIYFNYLTKLKYFKRRESSFN